MGTLCIKYGMIYAHVMLEKPSVQNSLNKGDIQKDLCRIEVFFMHGVLQNEELCINDEFVLWKGLVYQAIRVSQ